MYSQLYKFDAKAELDYENLSFGEGDEKGKTGSGVMAGKAMQFANVSSHFEGESKIESEDFESEKY